MISLSNQWRIQPEKWWSHSGTDAGMKPEFWQTSETFNWLPCCSFLAQRSMKFTSMLLKWMKLTFATYSLSVSPSMYSQQIGQFTQSVFLMLRPPHASGYWTLLSSSTHTSSDLSSNLESMERLPGFPHICPVQSSYMLLIHKRKACALKILGFCLSEKRKKSLQFCLIQVQIAEKQVWEHQ